MRKAITTMLRRYARILNITGGIITHQISPWKTGYPFGRLGVSSDLPSFCHEFNMVGEVTFDSDDDLVRFRELTEFEETCGHISLIDSDLRGGYHLVLDWSLHSADDPKIDVLRHFLYGSSMSYPVRQLELVTGRRDIDNGVRGVFALQPTFMMDEVQWWTYVEGTRDLPIYVPFGTWRTAIHEAKQARMVRRKESAQFSSPARTTVWKRHRGLKAANDRRQNDAQTALDKLVEVAQPLFTRLVAERFGKRGRPSYRARLKVMLKEQGYSVSDNQMKKVMARLREKDVNVFVCRVKSSLFQSDRFLGGAVVRGKSEEYRVKHWVS